MRFVIVLLVCLIIGSSAFQRMTSRSMLRMQQRSNFENQLPSRPISSHTWNPLQLPLHSMSYDPSSQVDIEGPSLSFDGNMLSAIVPAMLAILLFTPEDAMAQAGAYGILEGKAASLLHPATMMLLFGTSLYSGVLGLQYKRIRTLAAEIKELSQGLPTISTGKVSSPITEEIARIRRDIAKLEGNEDNDAFTTMSTLKKDLSILTSALDLDKTIVALSAERKSLLGGNVRDKHWLTGSILLGAGVSVSILGAFNTFMRTGRLFPGPHLYAGMGVTILWALAAAMVPEMQKGNEVARVAHIGFNVLNVSLFAWQVLTGFEIVLKVWEKTPW
jgi:hypothetical protein